MFSFKSFAPKALKIWLWRLASKHLHLDRQLKSGYQVRISSYSDWCIFNDLFVDGEYDPAINVMLDRVKGASSIRVIDLGANVGFFSARVLDQMQRRGIQIPTVEILLVEGSPALESELKERIGSIVQPGVRAKVLIGLVGEKSGTAQLKIGISQSGNKVVELADPDSNTVSYIDLEAQLGGITTINLLKCDIEGSEEAFLRNYAELLKKTEVAIFEFHEPDCPAAVGVRKVMEAGFARHQLLLDQGHAQTVFFER